MANHIELPMEPHSIHCGEYLKLERTAGYVGLPLDPVNFHRIGALGRFGLVVAISVRVSVCLSVPSPCNISCLGYNRLIPF